MAQLVERTLSKRKVLSSILSGSIYLVVAQLVERWTVVPLVMCSNHIDEINYSTRHELS